MLELRIWACALMLVMNIKGKFQTMDIVIHARINDSNTYTNVRDNYTGSSMLTFLQCMKCKNAKKEHFTYATFFLKKLYLTRPMAHESTAWLLAVFLLYLDLAYGNLMLHSIFVMWFECPTLKPWNVWFRDFVFECWHFGVMANFVFSWFLSLFFWVFDFWNIIWF